PLAKLVVEAPPVGDVFRESLLAADRDALDRRLDGSRIDAAGALAQHASDLAGEEAAERRVVDGGEGADRRHARRPETRLGARTDSGKQPDVEGCEESGLAPAPRDPH